MSARWNLAPAQNLFKYYMGLGTVTVPTSWYLAMSPTSADPAAGAFNETTVSGYGRKPITWTYAGDIYAQNSTQLDFVGLGAGTLLGQGIFDAASGGNLIFWSDLNTALLLPDNQTVSYKIGAIRVGFTR